LDVVDEAENALAALAAERVLSSEGACALVTTVLGGKVQLW
jgi:hypothetical protein